MDILVLIMLALFLIIIAFAVIIYVIVRRNSVDKKFGKTIEADMNEIDDDDDDDGFSNLNVVMPSSFKDNKLDEVSTKNNDDLLKNDINNDAFEDEEKNDNDVQIIEPVVFNSKEEEKVIGKIEDVVNILINKKNYIFLANDNVVSKNDYIKLMLDGKVYFGIVTKANYQRDILKLKIKPRKLIIVKNINKKENGKKEITNSKQEEIIEFVPRKKEKR